MSSLASPACLSEQLKPRASTSSLQLSQHSSGSPLILFLMLTHQIVLLFLSLSFIAATSLSLAYWCGHLSGSLLWDAQAAKKMGEPLSCFRTERLGTPRSVKNDRAVPKSPVYYWESLDKIPSICLSPAQALESAVWRSYHWCNKHPPPPVPGLGQKLPSQCIKSRDNSPQCQERMKV